MSDISKETQQEPLPFVSFVVPTLNSAATVGACLVSINAQDYPRDRYEVILADAGSSDATVQTARDAGIDLIVDNPLKTGEAGKSAGIKASKGELIALIDSDNILPDSNWLREMTHPFSDPEIMGSEPMEYTVRESDPALTRYFSMLGMSDPICLFVGNYDRLSYITGRWSDLPVAHDDCGRFLKLKLTEEALPTMGANGFVFRRKLLDYVEWDPYFFDIDTVHQAVQKGHNAFAKVKCGIVHLYCDKLSLFSRKQDRRIRDFLYFSQEKQRTYPWDRQKRSGIIKFTLSTLIVIPLIFQIIRGTCRKRDFAWLYHIPVCWITLWKYGWTMLRKTLGATQAPRGRSDWHQ